MKPNLDSKKTTFNPIKKLGIDFDMNSTFFAYAILEAAGVIDLFQSVTLKYTPALQIHRTPPEIQLLHIQFNFKDIEEKKINQIINRLRTYANEVNPSLGENHNPFSSSYNPNNKTFSVEFSHLAILAATGSSSLVKATILIDEIQSDTNPKLTDLAKLEEHRKKIHYYKINSPQISELVEKIDDKILSLFQMLFQKALDKAELLVHEKRHSPSHRLPEYPRNPEYTEAILEAGSAIYTLKEQALLRKENANTFDQSTCNSALQYIKSSSKTFQKHNSHFDRYLGQSLLMIALLGGILLGGTTIGLVIGVSTAVTGSFFCIKASRKKDSASDALNNVYTIASMGNRAVG